MVAVCLAGRRIMPDAGTESVTGRWGENLIARPRTDPAMGRGDSEPPGVGLFLAGTCIRNSLQGILELPRNYPTLRPMPSKST